MQAICQFPNGYGASVVRNPLSYGNEKGLYELAVLFKGRLCYSTPITRDVVGFLSPIEVTEILLEIEKLPVDKIKEV